jgi:hypothetical protein
VRYGLSLKITPSLNDEEFILDRVLMPLLNFLAIVEILFFCNPILFAICTSTFSKLCKNMYTVACRRVLP